jgi:hypothetical protein
MVVVRVGRDAMVMVMVVVVVGGGGKVGGGGGGGGGMCALCAWVCGVGVWVGVSGRDGDYDGLCALHV